MVDFVPFRLAIVRSKGEWLRLVMTAASLTFPLVSASVCRKEGTACPLLSFPWFAAVCEGWCYAVVVASGPWLLLHASVVFWKLNVHFFEVHKWIFFRSAVLLCFPLRFFHALLVEVSFSLPLSYVSIILSLPFWTNSATYSGVLKPSCSCSSFPVCLLLGHQFQLDGEVMTFRKCRRGSWFQLQFGGRLVGVVLSLFSPLCVVCILVSVDVTWYNAFLTSQCLQTSFKLASAVQIVVIQQFHHSQKISSFCTISGSCSLPHLLWHFCFYITACSISWFWIVWSLSEMMAFTLTCALTIFRIFNWLILFASVVLVSPQQVLCPYSDHFDSNHFKLVLSSMWSLGEELCKFAWSDP